MFSSIFFAFTLFILWHYFGGHVIRAIDGTIDSVKRLGPPK